MLYMAKFNVDVYIFKLGKVTSRGSVSCFLPVNAVPDFIPWILPFVFEEYVIFTKVIQGKDVGVW